MKNQLKHRWYNFKTLNISWFQNVRQVWERFKWKQLAFFIAKSHRGLQKKFCLLYPYFKIAIMGNVSICDCIQQKITNKKRKKFLSCTNKSEGGQGHQAGTFCLSASPSLPSCCHLCSQYGCSTSIIARVPSRKKVAKGKRHVPAKTW